MSQTLFCLQAAFWAVLSQFDCLSRSSLCQLLHWQQCKQCRLVLRNLKIHQYWSQAAPFFILSSPDERFLSFVCLFQAWLHCFRESSRSLKTFILPFESLKIVFLKFKFPITFLFFWLLIFVFFILLILSLSLRLLRLSNLSLLLICLFFSRNFPPTFRVLQKSC